MYNEIEVNGLQAFSEGRWDELDRDTMGMDDVLGGRRGTKSIEDYKAELDMSCVVRRNGMVLTTRSGDVVTT